MVDIYVTSDNHFRHGNIYKFIGYDGQRVRKEFESCAEGDLAMIELWNQTVKPEDHVWNLGDFMMGSNGWAREECISIAKRLNGHKRLILGNHDCLDVRTYRDAGFQKVVGAKEIQVAGLRLLCTHYPAHESSLFKRDGSVHGHTHEKPDLPSVVGSDEKLKSWMNMSVERTGYKPVHIEEIAKLMKEKLTNA